MTRLYITRHGQTEWNLEGRMQGQKDSKLTPLGEQQAKWLGKRLADDGIDVIISSSSGRTIRTAEIIRGEKNIEIISNDRLREIHLGEWEGLLHMDIEKQWAKEHRNFWKAPHLYKSAGGETFLEILDRAGSEIEKIISEFSGKNILIVSHAVVLLAIIAYFENKKINDFWNSAYMHPTCLNIVEIKNDCRNIIMQGDVSHYNEEATVV